MNIGDLCNREVVTIHNDATIYDAAARMRDEHVGSLVVVRDAGGMRIPVGVITDRDLVVEVLAKTDHPASDLTVGDLIDHRAVSIPEDRSVREGIDLMLAHGFRRVPVVARTGALVGILAYDDLIEYLSDTLAATTQIVRRGERREREHRP